MSQADTGSSEMGIGIKKFRTVLTAFDQAGLVVIDKADHERLLNAVDRQQDEIDALELRIKRLLDEPRHQATGCRFKCKPCH